MFIKLIVVHVTTCMYMWFPHVLLAGSCGWFHVPLCLGYVYERTEYEIEYVSVYIMMWVGVAFPTDSVS